MHWRRARRVADGADGKTGPDADAWCRAVGATVHGAGLTALSAAQ